MEIYEPSEHKKEKSIEYILSRGLSRKKTLWGIYGEMYRALGLANIFQSMGFAILVPLFTFIMCLIISSFFSMDSMYTLLFAASPVLFVGIAELTDFGERRSRMYDLKMSCKYTIWQIIVFRMICYSFAGMVFCVAVGAVLSSLPFAYEFFRASALSLCSLMFFAFVMAFFMRRLNILARRFIVIALWAAVCVAPRQFFGEQWEMFLSRVPVVIVVCAAVLFIILFFIEAKKLMLTNKEAIIYARG